LHRHIRRSAAGARRGLVGQQDAARMREYAVSIIAGDGE
jgi:hypothetical protein